MDLQIKGKTALVLASSDGLGKAIAHELANEGANVMLTSRTEENLKLAKEEIEKTATGSVAYCLLDQTKQESIAAAVKTTREIFGSISILVNNSGGPPAGSFEDFEDEDWQKAFELTLLSYIRVIRMVLPDLKENKGRILNNTSSSTKEPIDGLTLSNVFRVGILGLAKTLSQELAEDDILVNTIGPGRIQTKRVDKLDQANAKKKAETKEAIQAANLSTIPMGRYGKPEEFAKVATFLVSGANSYLTGQNLLVDGGKVKAV
ncbi:SDR family oxidoreductase [Tetragenococcus muriaticus]|uniref:3-oxoacyl-[acyl-carrier protein] reductase n=2 Tax=Tetragenococcus muriaticus TaxID=64642 RepID=A0A091CCW6_9ENTE|nr:SDR family oxidoreductase [Tetragenococcus muriaticus]KFN91048.1 3-oxoacyl-[acyl-carrier protein] reductase [Tetragenococcus muriaticus 3MR10-3]KFN91556.1 3-oxoacyl-[acyl-carrier protein] reductase [Tetragenococcus muriaticus PMC-11-5]GMA47184.1 3-oxoacyl-ACP reductase [Tetragenococcus muriaticus]